MNAEFWLFVGGFSCGVVFMGTLFFLADLHWRRCPRNPWRKP